MVLGLARRLCSAHHTAPVSGSPWLSLHSWAMLRAMQSSPTQDEWGERMPVALFLLQRIGCLLEVSAAWSPDTTEWAWHAEGDAYLSGAWTAFSSSASAGALLSAMRKAILGRAPARSSMLLRREAICSELDSKDFLAFSLVPACIRVRAWC